MEEEFCRALSAAVKELKEVMCHFGIRPTRAETGYGYVEIETSDYVLSQTTERMVSFHEKPNQHWLKNILPKQGIFYGIAGCLCLIFKQ